MKHEKVLFGVFALFGLVASLYAGVLMSTQIKGTKTYCTYSDGIGVYSDTN